MARSAGLDIGTHTIRVVELEKKREGAEVSSYGTIDSPLSSPLPSNNEELSLLVKRIKMLFKEANISVKGINLSIPEALASTQVIETPLLSERELKSSMKWQAEQYIPLPLSDVSYDYTIVEEDKDNGRMRVLLSAVPLKIIDKYKQIAEKSGFDILLIETEILSVTRALSGSIPKDSVTVIINFEQNASNFAFVQGDSLLFVRSVPTGGLALSRAISQKMNISILQAERFKMAYGVDKTKLDGKIYAAVEPLMREFVAELNKGFVYFKEHFPKRASKLILLSGYGSLMPGIVRFMTESFGIETQRGDPFFNLSFKKGYAPPSRIASDLAVATGAALAG